MGLFCPLPDGCGAAKRIRVEAAAESACGRDVIRFFEELLYFLLSPNGFLQSVSPRAGQSICSSPVLILEKFVAFVAMISTGQKYGALVTPA